MLLSSRPSPPRYFLIFVAQQAACPNRKYLSTFWLFSIIIFLYPFFQGCVLHFDGLSFNLRKYVNKKVSSYFREKAATWLVMGGCWGYSWQTLAKTLQRISIVRSIKIKSFNMVQEAPRDLKSFLASSDDTFLLNQTLSFC